MPTEVQSDSTKIVGDTVEVTEGLIEATVSTDNSAYMEVMPAEYSLSSGGIFAGGALTGTIPEWVITAIQQEIETGGSIANIVAALQDSINSLDAGITQNLTSLNTSEISINNRIDTVVSVVDTNRAAAIDLVATKVTAEESGAIALAMLTAQFGPDIEAYITSIATTYASENLAYAADVGLIVATVGDTTARVTTSEYAIVGTEDEIRNFKATVADDFFDLGNQIDSSLTTIDATIAEQAIELALLDDSISEEESARILAITTEQETRISAIAGRIAAEAILDGKITDEEAARIESAGDLATAYKEYNRVITLALADGVLTPEEQILIAAAASEVAAAKGRIDNAIAWSSGASSFVTDPDDDEVITGWKYGDGSGEVSTFAIRADKFYLGSSSEPGYRPFSIDAINHKIVFDGKVTFGNGAVGTIDEAIVATVTTISVGDKNINITDNLIPTTSLIGDTDNAGYQFVGSPAKSGAVGIDTFSEPQVSMPYQGDEIYSPFTDEQYVSHYYRFAIKGITTLDKFMVVALDSSDGVTYNNVTYSMLDGNVLNSTTWYSVEGVIHPSGVVGNPITGSIRLGDGTKIGTVSDYIMPSAATKMLLGWKGVSTISRMKLAKITADTVTSELATSTYIDAKTRDLATTEYVDTTEIDGGRITTGKVESHDGGTYFDLANNQIKMDNGSFILDSTAAGTNASPNIKGSYIKGSHIEGSTIQGTTITGSTIVSSTMKLRDLIVLTDDGYETESILHGSHSNTDIYAYNAVSAVSRLSSSTGNRIQFLGIGSKHYNGYYSNSTFSYLGWTLVAEMSGISGRFKVYRGTTELGSIGRYETKTIAGMAFRGTQGQESQEYDDNYFVLIWAKPISTISLSGEGELRFTATSNQLTDFSIVCYNL